MGSCTDTIGKTLVERLDDMAAGWLCAGLPDADLPAEAAREIERLRAGYDRYEVVRRMNVSAFQDAYVLNRRTGKPFDEIVAEQAHFYGLRVRA